MKAFIIVLSIFPVLIFAGAYFYGNSIQYLQPDGSLSGQIYFSAYKENVIYLDVYKLNLSDNEFLSSLLEGKKFDYTDKLKFLKTIKYSIKDKYFNSKVVLPNDLGIYFLRITNSNKFLASSYVFVSNLKLININDGNKKFIYLRNSITGAPIKKATLFFTTESNSLKKSEVINGFIDMSKYKYSYIYACTDNSFTSAYSSTSSPSKFAVYITTDRPVYRPGQKVGFKGFFLQNNNNGYSSIGNKEMEVQVQDPNGSLIYDKKMQTNSFGTLNGTVTLSENAFVGYYSINVKYGEYHFSDGFYVQAYKKPTFYIKISSDKQRYIYKDKMNFKIELKYFNGQPVVGAKASVYVYVNSDNYDYYDQSSKLLYYNSLITDSNGSINLPVILNEKADGHCKIEITAADETQREIDKTYSVNIFQGDISFKFDKYYYDVKPNEEFEVRFSANNLSGNPLSGTAQATFCGKRYEAKVTNGHGKLILKTEKIGNFPLILKFKDCSYHTYIYSYKFSYSNYHPKDTTIFTDKKEYEPSENVKVAIYSPNNINGLLILGGERIYSLQEVSYDNKSIIKSIKLPENIGERNVWVFYVPFYSSGENYYSHKIGINLKDKNLKIKISTDKKIYQPKDTVNVHIETNENTDLALSVVDEAIYSIVKQRGNIFDRIYPKSNYPKLNISFSSKYIPYDLISQLQKPNIFAQTKNDYKFASFKSKETIKNNVRKYFPDTALWIPSKILKDGKCDISFKIPDSITSWRIRALGIDKTCKVGESSTDIVSTKNFYVQPILPMFFREGDKSQIGMTVHNNTNSATKVTLSIIVKNGINLSDSSNINFVINPHSSKTFYKDCTITYSSTKSYIKINASSSNMQDQVLYRIPILPYTLDRNIYKLFVLNNGKRDFLIPEKDYYNLQINVYQSFKTIIENSLKRLISYPYGCVEQTMSSFLPAIISKSYNMNFDNLNDIVRKGLVKLFAYQHNDGGWGWWSRDKSLTWMTDYVMNGLYYAQKSGYDVPSLIINNGISFIQKHLDGYGDYVLSLYGKSVSYTPKNIVDEVYMSYVDKNYIKPLVSRLTNENGYLYLNIKSDDFFTTNVQLNSIFLQSLIKWKENPKIIYGVLRYILSKKDGDFWYDTKDTSFAAMALMSYDKNINLNVKIKNSTDIKSYRTNSIIHPTVYGKYTLEGTGIVEIEGKYKEVPNDSVNEGIELKRLLFKKLEVIGTNPKGDKTIIDAMLPLNGNFEPISIKAYKYDKQFIYNGKLYLKYFDGIESYSFEFAGHNIKVDEKGTSIDGKMIVKGKIQTIKGTGKKLTITSKKGYYIYDYKALTFHKVNNIVDADTSQNKTAILTNDKVIIVKSDYTIKIKTHKQYRGVNIYNGKVYLSGGYTNVIDNDKIIKLYPVSGDFILSLSKNNILLAGNVKFTGNSETVGPLGLYSIKFILKPYNLKSGDIVMSKINAKCNEGNYILIEDYFPSCAQVLKKYSEKRFTGSYKLDYMWYEDWDYWYLSRELKDDRIGFFTYHFDKGSIKYYYRLTLKGIYKILPTQAYTMYHKGIYGQSNTDSIIVH